MSLHDIEDIILHVCIMSPNLMTIVSCVSIYNIALKLFNVENNVYTITIPLCLYGGGQVELHHCIVE